MIFSESTYDKLRELWEQWASLGSIPNDADFAHLTRAYEVFYKLEQIFQPQSASFMQLDTLKKCQRARAERAKAEGAKFEPPGMA